MEVKLKKVKKKKTAYYQWQLRIASGKEVCATPGCGETRHLTIDHIVPAFMLWQMCLDKNEVLYNFDENFQILCRYCNQMKSARLDMRNPKTYEVLNKVLTASREYHLEKRSGWIGTLLEDSGGTENGQFSNTEEKTSVA